MHCRSHGAQGQVNPYMSPSCHTDIILSEKEQIVPEAKEEIAQKKKIPEETEKTKTDCPGIKLASKKC